MSIPRHNLQTGTVLLTSVLNYAMLSNGLIKTSARTASLNRVKWHSLGCGIEIPLFHQIIDVLS